MSRTRRIRPRGDAPPGTLAGAAATTAPGRTVVADGAASRAAARARARSLAALLDTAVRVPGTSWRFGLDPLLGLVPGAGDLAGAALGGWILMLAAREGASPSVLLRMVGNIGVDTLLGVVPLVGDLFDAAFKANVRNVALLERLAEEPASVERSSALLVGFLLLLLLAVVGAGIAATVLLIRWLF